MLDFQAIALQEQAYQQVRLSRLKPQPHMLTPQPLCHASTHGSAYSHICSDPKYTHVDVTDAANIFDSVRVDLAAVSGDDDKESG
ncbi:hypothetical protein Tco_0725547 [Tanacetum coccineum]|uniref:Uncharacterized protein n=1 Tax=Tanacetum coccineum TaxID=301880 RepID=A0ABQ4YE15_9ASTR